MASMCLCAPTDHAGSFRCHLHRLSVQRQEPLLDSSSQVSSRGSCLCAPTSHPGSFRCRLHQTKNNCWGGRPIRPSANVSEPSCVPDLTPAKPDDSVCVRKVPFARINRLVSEAKLQSESNKEMVPDQGLPNAVAAVEEDVVESVAKKTKSSLAPVCSTSSLRVSEEKQENSAHADLAAAAKRNKEATSRSHRRPSVAKERRLRAKSDLLATLL